MRKKLRKIGSKTRNRYKGTVVRFGIKPNPFSNFSEKTILLKNIIKMDSQKVIADHLWFTVGKQLKELNLKARDVISFNARVGSYKKGYKHDEKDYNLKYMTKIKLENKQKREPKEGELTSATEPTLEELKEARIKAQKKGN